MGKMALCPTRRRYRPTHYQQGGSLPVCVEISERVGLAKTLTSFVTRREVLSSFIWHPGIDSVPFKTHGKSAANFDGMAKNANFGLVRFTF